MAGVGGRLKSRVGRLRRSTPPRVRARSPRVNRRRPRAGNNVYGPHQFPEKLIPKFTNQLARGRAVTLHGTGENTRNFLFVEDVARAFDCILHKAEIGKVYNIGVFPVSLLFRRFLDRRRPAV